MAPKWLGRLNKNGMPQNSIITSVLGCWLIIAIYTLDSSNMAYTYLLAVSGFTGAMAWISICWSQYYNFRKQIIKDGLEDTLKYKTPFFPYITLFGIWVQVFCLVVLAFTDDLKSALYAGVPMLFYTNDFLYKYRHKLSIAKNEQLTEQFAED